MLDGNLNNWIYYLDIFSLFFHGAGDANFVRRTPKVAVETHGEFIIHDRR